MNDTPPDDSAARAFAEHLSAVARDMARIAELQVRLFADDMQMVRTTPSMIKYTPKPTEGYNYGFGEWILEADENGNAKVMASPGFSGTWPMVDNCRGYACIFFTKGDLSDEKKEIYLNVKKSIDDVLASTCK